MYKIPGWVGVLLIGAAVSASAWSIRSGLADYQMRRETVRGIEQAIALAPDNAEYYARLASLIADSDPKASTVALQKAVALNPMHAAAWIELGLRAEANAEDQTAEECLLKAAEADRTFLPRWTLGNYYFRRHDEARFWLWMKHAAEMAYGDADPLFRLCGRVEEDGKLIDRLELQNGDLRAAYVSYLLGLNRIDLIGPAVSRLLSDNREADVPLLLTVCEKFLDAGQGEKAAEIWNGLAKSGRVWAAADEDGQKVVNSGFAAPPTSRGLDWRLPAVEGISVAREADSGGLRITFSGREPEELDALVQLIPLRNNQSYELKFAYRTEGIASGAGLHWRVVDPSHGAVLAESVSLASETTTEGRLPFDTPPLGSLMRLALSYRRAAGTTRLEGFLILQEVTLRPAVHSPGSFSH
jgi:tetratricopeptide (TPR) repeat protein